MEMITKNNANIIDYTKSPPHTEILYVGGLSDPLFDIMKTERFSCQSCCREGRQNVSFLFPDNYLR